MDTGCNFEMHLPYYFIFKLFRQLYLFFDYLFWVVFRYSLINGRNLEKAKSGNLVTILAKSNPTQIGSLLRPEQFIFKHKEYVDPIDFILKKDNVTFMAIFESEVWFSVMKNGENPYNLTVAVPFAFFWQYYKSEQILIVDHETLHKIASGSCKPNGNCILINNSGRCGSTLLNQVN